MNSTKNVDINKLKADAKKLTFILPNTFTALNMACGFGSILLSFKGNFYLASVILLLGGIFDSVDGRVARLTGTQSLFGEQFDSISDVVSFGIAPSILVYNRFFLDFGRAGMVVSFIFLLCGALRLARFNANIHKVDSNFFQGLPIPGGAIGLVSFVLVTLVFPEIIVHPIAAAVYVVFYGLLMISNIPFCSFKSSDWARKHIRVVLALIFLTLCLIFLYEELMVAFLISLYVLGSLVYFVIKGGGIGDIFVWRGEGEVDEE